MPRIKLHEWAFMDLCTSQQLTTHTHMNTVQWISLFCEWKSLNIFIHCDDYDMKESYQIRYSGPTLICMELNFVEP